MTTTIDYLDALKTKLGAASDYELAKKLGWGQSRISNYRTGRSFFDDDTCLNVASLLDLPPIEVLLNVHAERSTNPLVKASFSTFLKQLATTAAMCLITTGVMAFKPAPAFASSLSETDQGIYIIRINMHMNLICTKRTKKRALLVIKQ